MSEFKGTPGPWHLDGDVVRDADDGLVAEIFGPIADLDANGNLIAAAPDLLWALQEILANPLIVSPQGRAAIAKALGDE